MRALNVLLSIAVSLAIALLVFEAGLRVLKMGPPDALNQFDPKVGWVKKPDYRLTKSFKEIPAVTFVTNAQGLRDDPMDSPAKPDGVYRVMMLGDSFTLGYTVDRADLFVDILERRLQAEGRKVEIINAGTEGYSTDQEVAWYLEYGVDYDADLVVLLPYDNDVFWCGQKDYVGSRKPRFEPDGSPESTEDLPDERGGLWRTTAIGRLLGGRPGAPTFVGRMAGLPPYPTVKTSGGRDVAADFGALFVQRPALLEEGMTRITGSIRALLQHCVAAETDVVLAPIPSQAAVDEEFRARFGREFLGVQPGEWNAEQIVQLLVGAAKRAGVDGVDARPAMRSAHWEEPCYNDFFGKDREWHFNAAGNHAFAEFLYGALAPYLPPKLREADPALLAAQTTGAEGDEEGGVPFFVMLYGILWTVLTALYYGHYRDEPAWLPPIKVALILAFVFGTFMGVDAGVTWLAAKNPTLSRLALGGLLALVLGFVAFKMGNRLATMAELVWAFTLRGHWYLMPMVVVLLTIGSLLVVAASSPLVAPFIYTLF